MLVAFYEVTEWKRRQHQAMEAGRLASLGEMVAGITHEINNPLAAIMGLSQLALRRDLDPAMRKDLESVLAEARTAAEVVANLRVFGGVVRPRKERVDVMLVLQKVLDMKSDWFRAHSASISTRGGRQPLLVDGDAHQLEQLIINIITNAQQALAEMNRPGILDIEAEAVGDAVVLSFSNNGPEIESRYLPRLFDPFFTTRDVGQGTGLGLSMCHRIAREHGGTIRAESAPGLAARPRII